MLSNTTLSFSSLAGPAEKVEFYGHPIVYIATSVYGHPHVRTFSSLIITTQKVEQFHRFVWFS
jgi:hypothetical protein